MKSALLRRHHPDWVNVLWTLPELRAFLEAAHAEALALFDAYAQDENRADMARYYVLESFGGHGARSRSHLLSKLVLSR